MTIITHRPRPALPSAPQPRPARRRMPRSAQAGLTLPALKASRFGLLGLLLLILITGIPLPESLASPFLFLLVVPGFLIVCLATGLLAAIGADRQIKNSRQGGEVAWMAGFWTGIWLGCGAMVVAATGNLLQDFGQALVLQSGPDQLAAWGAWVTPSLIALSGRVFGALLIYGLIGSLIIAALSSIGGLIYPKLRSR